MCTKGNSKKKKKKLNGSNFLRNFCQYKPEIITSQAFKETRTETKDILFV